MAIHPDELKTLLKLGQNQFRIQSFQGEALLVQRLHEIGLRRGDGLIYVGRAPFGGPLLFRMGAIVIALREEEFQCLQLSKHTA